MPTVKLYGIEVADVRYLFPDAPGASCSNFHPPEAIIGIAQHHDGIIMPPGDADYNGTTLDEDMERLQAIYAYNLSRLGGYPYQFTGSPNGRLFWCRSLETWGAHVGGMNDRLLGIAMMGDYRKAEPPVEGLCSLSLGYIALWRFLGHLSAVKGHGQWAPGTTECPGPALWIPKALQFAAFNVARFPG
jgi:hypothetical protein